MTAIMEPDTDAATAPGPALLSAAEAEAKLIDAAVREARDGAWCAEFERLMSVTFPDRPRSGEWIVDSDGINKHGYTADGYDPDGYHRDTGRNRDGYDRNGYDADGLHRVTGRDRNGYDRDGYNVDGYNRAGFDHNGRTREGLTADSPEYRERFRYNASGYDREGFHHNRAGGRPRHYTTRLTRDAHAAHLADPDNFRYDRYGFDRDGINTDGYDYNGFRVRDRTPEAIAQRYGYDQEGYDANGRDQYGRTREENGRRY